VELKITRMINMNLKIFGENFIIFGQVELSEKNQMRKID
jgi:hypothetical protein